MPKDGQTVQRIQLAGEGVVRRGEFKDAVVVPPKSGGAARVLNDRPVEDDRDTVRHVKTGVRTVGRGCGGAHAFFKGQVVLVFGFTGREVKKVKRGAEEVPFIHGRRGAGGFVVAEVERDGTATVKASGQRNGVPKMVRGTRARAVERPGAVSVFHHPSVKMNLACRGVQRCDGVARGQIKVI